LLLVTLNAQNIQTPTTQTKSNNTKKSSGPINETNNNGSNLTKNSIKKEPIADKNKSNLKISAQDKFLAQLNF